ncbi:MAG TPA: flippase-like domain-containing protein [Methanocorpusculum sp.]|nr:flippase-like domain-containing protein [Methanocorpusculum sp.]
MDKKQKRLLVISLAISLTVLFIVLIITINEETISALQSCIPAFLILAIAMHIISLFFWAARIKLMCRSLGYKVSMRHCFNLVCSNMFIAAVTPSSIGGEPVRVYEITKAGVPGGKATAVVTMERVFDGIVLTLGTGICVFLLGMFFSNIQLPDGCMIAAYCGAGFFAALVLLFFVMAGHPAWGHAFARKIASLITKRKDDAAKEKMQVKFSGYTDNFYGALHEMAGKSKSGIVWGFFFSALYWANEFIIAFFICWGLGVEPTAQLFLLSIILQLLLTVILMIPITPGGVGIAEVSLGLLYAIIIPASIVGIFVLIYRFIFYYFNLIIGFIASMLIMRREARGNEVRKEAV